MPMYIVMLCVKWQFWYFFGLEVMEAKRKPIRGRPKETTISRSILSRFSFLKNLEYSKSKNNMGLLNTFFDSRSFRGPIEAKVIRGQTSYLR